MLIWRPLENEQQEEDCGGNTELAAGKVRSATAVWALRGKTGSRKGNVAV